jgi:hypothetical protein
MWDPTEPRGWFLTRHLYISCSPDIIALGGAGSGYKPVGGGVKVASLVSPTYVKIG